MGRSKDGRGDDDDDDVSGAEDSMAYRQSRASAMRTCTLSDTSRRSRLPPPLPCDPYERLSGVVGRAAMSGTHQSRRIARRRSRGRAHSTVAAIGDGAKASDATITATLGIARIRQGEWGESLVPGETVNVDASGWAWAEGGRNIVRIDVSGDGGKSWCTGNLTKGSDQPQGRAWAWVHWKCRGVPATMSEDGTTIELCCKATDSSFNSQPGSSDGMWNVRGLANNSWFELRHIRKRMHNDS